MKKNFDYAVIVSPHSGKIIGGPCVCRDAETATIVFGGYSITGKLLQRDFDLSSFVPGAAGRSPSK